MSKAESEVQERDISFHSLNFDRRKPSLPNSPAAKQTTTTKKHACIIVHSKNYITLEGYFDQDA